MNAEIEKAVRSGQKIDILLKLHGKTVAGIRLTNWKGPGRLVRLSGRGVFKDRASDEAIRAAFLAGDILPWQAIVPGFGTVDGPFQITSLEYSGTHDGEVTFETALESAGALTFEAA